MNDQQHSSADALTTTKLPDGSGFAVASLPLPQDHWLYASRCAEWDSERDTSADTPHPILTHAQRDAVVAAVRYAIRSATMCGQDMDFDPDALVLNAVYALCGPFSSLLEDNAASPVEQPAAAPIDGPVTYSGEPLTLTGAQLLEALDFIAPDRDPDQLESEVTIQYGEGHTGKGMYCWCTEYPDEGAIFLDGSIPATIGAPADAAEAREPHSDDVAVDSFDAAMKHKLALARAKGRGGWETCSPADLSRMLREHVEKGDPRDVANFCMMLWHHGSPIVSAPADARVAQADARVGLTDEQREAIEYAITRMDLNVSNRDAYTAAKELRALLNGADHAE
ncbi:hypothetical protein LGM48_24540 [Burkholderia multivorans]|nr:hypothetical protein [Burkholderia multivorans]